MTCWKLKFTVPVVPKSNFLFALQMCQVSLAQNMFPCGEGKVIVNAVDWNFSLKQFNSVNRTNY